MKNKSPFTSLLTVCTFLPAQGSEAVRALPPPEELLFTVDEKVRADISLAKQRYLESVSKDKNLSVSQPAVTCP